MLPYRWEPLIAVVCLGGIGLYLAGLRRGARPGWPRNACFLTGMALMYVVTQTRFDYFSQYIFFMHRIQHLVLHHLGAMLIALANPLPVLAGATPRALREKLIRPIWLSAPIQRIYAFVQHPFVAGFLFVGLIYFWLIPAIHFDAMLSRSRYNLMNWSMAVDGVLFWWVVLNPYPPGGGEHRSVGYGKRCVLLALVMFPQILLGAYIALSQHHLYEIYEVCGRPWPIRAASDQTQGGLIIWIPSAMMSVVGALIILPRWRRREQGAGARRAGGRGAVTVS